MPKEWLNEAERFLFENWNEARLLEESMKAVRLKYKELFDRIVDEVTEAHEELDVSAVHFTQYHGVVGFGRKSWPAGEAGWPAGLWVSNLQLEMLISEGAEPPIAEIWVPSKVTKKCGLEIAAAKTELLAAAKSQLNPEEYKHTAKGDSDETLLYLPSPTSNELVGLLKEGNGEKFVGRFVTLLDLMAKFLPAIDQLFQRSLAARPND